MHLQTGKGENIDGVLPGLTSITDNPNPVTGGNLTYRSAAQFNNSWNWNIHYRAALSYVTGSHQFKVGFNNVFNYFIEVTKPNLHLVPPEYIRKQTTANAERYITSEMKEIEVKLLNAEEEIHSLEVRLYKELLRRVADHAEALLKTGRALAAIDVCAALADVAARNGYARPFLSADDTLEIRAGRHPVVEQLLRTERFVPNDAAFSNGKRVHIITGPNMSGKSTYLRQVALIVLMAQIGSFVPASKAAIGAVDRVFTRVGASDDLSRGQSTFMVEMRETADILAHASPRSLVILDEIGRGTSTFDGLSIAWAVAEYLSQVVRCRALFATHYHELTALDRDPHVQNHSVSARELDGDIVFLHRVVSGPANQSYGVAVAKLAGLPEDEVARREERAPGLLERLARTLAAASPEMFVATGEHPIPVETEEDEIVKTTERVIEEAASEGRVVLVGRGAQAVLATRPHTLFVYVVASLPFRRKIAVERLGVDLVHFMTPQAYLTALPSVYQPHDLLHRHYPEQFSPIHARYREHAYRTFSARASVVAVMTEFGRSDLMGAYDEQVEAKVCNALITAAGAAVVTFATEAAFTGVPPAMPATDAVIDAGIAVWDARKRPADILAMRTRRWGRFKKLKDADGRPIIPTGSAGPVNVAGVGSVMAAGFIRSANRRVCPRAVREAI